jgi:hypothetical protein
MRLVSRKAWSTGRKLMGNVLPIAVSVPFGLWGVWLISTRGVFLGPELGVLLLMPAALWVASNFVGLYQNGAIRLEVARKLKLGPPSEDSPRFFVGFARPSYRGLLDPHEDVGFLFLLPDAVEFRGECGTVALRRAEVLGVRFRPNVHTLIGLGRWVSIEGTVEGTPVRMLVEPRERPTLLGNKRLSKRLRLAIERWIDVKGPRT